MTKEPVGPPDTTTTTQRGYALQGWTVLRVWHGAVYVRIPEDYAVPIQGGCQCAYCKSHPNEIPSWDTLGIPLEAREMTWTVHAPEWKSTDRVSAEEQTKKRRDPERCNSPLDYGPNTTRCKLEKGHQGAHSDGPRYWSA